MDEKELRIGNVTDKGIIKSFYENGIHVGFGKCYDYKDVKPIPLTEDWAVKFGYECLIEMAVDFSDLSKYDIEITSENLKKLNVHEAQNLYFALTSQELEIRE